MKKDKKAGQSGGCSGQRAAGTCHILQPSALLAACRLESSGSDQSGAAGGKGGGAAFLSKGDKNLNFSLTSPGLLWYDV